MQIALKEREQERIELTSESVRYTALCHVICHMIGRLILKVCFVTGRRGGACEEGGSFEVAE